MTSVLVGMGIGLLGAGFGLAGAPFQPGEMRQATIFVLICVGVGGLCGLIWTELGVEG